MNPRQVEDDFLYLGEVMNKKPWGTGSIEGVGDATREDALGSATLQHHPQRPSRVPAIDLPLHHCP